MAIQEYSKKKGIKMVKEDALEKVTGGVDGNEEPEEQRENKMMERSNFPGKKGFIASDVHNDQSKHLF